MTGGLVSKLVQWQRAKGLSDLAMAETLGLSRQGWQKIRTGENTPGVPLIRAVLREYPQFTLECLAFLRGESPDCPQPAQDEQETASDAPAA